ncbi:peptidyl-tRNA hydrolase [Pleomassaria siparia CBS 279.74]|uniref:peptidyl-tRNA hydrolase n=1 Tax=Pleomassaria siparia CBS 279.74 TaxID=1314801 RepID=A0A6G1KR06_9PLEO|nr:peptidyl-tRNA hydrolase [Pleomassaria siparia CBS 279.74]
MSNTHARAHVRGPQPILGPRLNLQSSSKPIQVGNLNSQDHDDDDSKSEDNTAIAVPISRKEKRKQRQEQKDFSSSTKPSTDTETLTVKPNPAKKTKPAASTSSIPTSLSMPPGTSTVYPLLVCSLGNPGAQYANTLHSAGHTVLSVIQARGLYTPFSKGLSGLVSRPDTTRYSFSIIGGLSKTKGTGLVEGEDNFVLWQSTSLMNISGGSVRKAWTKFDQETRARGAQGRLVIVHDELEAALGKVSVKDGSASPRGHNGLKSCQASLGGIKWWRVGVGIGRPESREASVVSKFVLSKMDKREQAGIENAAFAVLSTLRDIQEGKK